MSRAIDCDIHAPEAGEVVMEVIETGDVLEDFLCTTRPVMEHAGILVSPAPPPGDWMPAGYRSAHRSRH